MLFSCGFPTEFYNSHFSFYYFSQVIMLKFICLSRQLLKVTDFVIVQEEDLLGYNMKIYQHYNKEFGVPALVILIVLIYENKVAVLSFISHALVFIIFLR